MPAEIPTTDPEVLAAWPTPCQSCGRAWERIGFMEFELSCECPVYVPAVKEVTHAG